MRTAPNALRSSASTRLPTAAIIRLTWWYLPSVSVRRRRRARRSLRMPRRGRLSLSSCSSTPARSRSTWPASTACLQAHLVDLGDVVLRRSQAMDERAVVGEQEDAGRVLVEPADRLHAALAQRRRQQRVDAGVMARLQRALVAGRLVHDDERALAIRPARPAADPEPELAATSSSRSKSSTTPMPSTSRQPFATSAAHSRRVPKPCEKSRSAGLTVRARIQYVSSRTTTWLSATGQVRPTMRSSLNSPTTARWLGIGQLQARRRHAGDAARDARRRALAVERDAVARHAEVAARPRQRDQRLRIAVGVGRRSARRLTTDDERGNGER